MANRIQNPTPAQRAPFGLVAWLEETKIALPLKGVECGFVVCGDVVSVEIDQLFHQNSAQALDCLYTFPLPASAAVYRCEMHVNERVIRARVEEREQAKAIAREKKAAGHRTALVEMERDNLFTLSLGNVQPGDIIVIRFAYFQTLSRLDDWTSFNVPFCPGIRYIPGTPLLRAPRGKGAMDDTDQVPDASRISPPRIDRLHPDAAYLSVEGTVEHPLDDVKDISSPSHPVLVKDAKGSSSVIIADQKAVPDCDFVLRWTELEAAQVKPVGWVTKSHADTFALVRFRAPTQVAASDTYSQDVYFLIDRSGSMAGLKWQKAVEAFRAFLGVLGENDRVWATFFESSVRDVAEKPLPAPELARDAGVRKIESLGTAGGTELLPALEHVVGKIATHSADRPVSLVLITDGEVGNEAPILQALARHSQLRVHVFGIDVAINDGFLQKLAAQQHGTSCLLSPQDDIVGAVARLGNRLRRPVLTAIRVQDGWELAGHGVPDLFEGEILSLPLKAGQRVPSQVTNALTLTGSLPDGTVKTYQFNLAETSAMALPLLWAKRRIDYLLAKGDQPAAIALAKASNIACEGTAFIAWDDAEKVAVSAEDREIYQPAMQVRYLRGARYAVAGAVRCVSPRADFLECMDAESWGAENHEERETWFERIAEALLKRRGRLPDLAQWRHEMEGYVLFQTAAGRQLLDVIGDWFRSSPREAASLGGQLEVLSEITKRCAGKTTLIETLQCVVEWVQTVMPEPFLTQALEKCRLLAEELKAKNLVKS